MQKNELNVNARGGTELMANRVLTYLGDDASDIEIICSRFRGLNPDKKNIYWCHDLATDPEVAHLKNGGWEKFDVIVFVSHWQQQMYNLYLGVPYSAGIVIPNGIEPFEHNDTSSDKVKLIYFSTPHRGLTILYGVYKELSKEFGDSIELNVYSSFDLYGWESRDEPFRELFDKLEEHPHINYSKSISNELMREKVQESDILAYPSIWWETSCLTLIESMSAGLSCVHSSLAALPETSMGLTNMYGYTDDVQEHANRFYVELRRVIQNHLSYNYAPMTHLCQEAILSRYDITHIVDQWKEVIDSLD